MISPSLTSTTSYQFYVTQKVSSLSSFNYPQLIKISVNQTTSTSTTRTTKEATTEVKSCIYSSSSVMAVGAASSVTTSLLSSSSPQAIWMMSNQLQLIMLLPLTKAYIPDDIINFSAGVSFVNFNFDFIPMSNSPAGTGLISVLDNSSNEDYLANLGAPFKS